MAKENTLFLVIALLMLILPGTGFAGKAIQTTQHIIVIDPGHGGPRNGIISSGGIEEKTITLELAKKTAQILESRYNTLLTRTEDIDIPVRERIFTANKNQADLFISIHLNHSNQASGFFYYFDSPENHKHSSFKKDNTWESQSLLHQPGSKKAANSFLTIFSTHKKHSHFSQKGSPVLLLEGATMPAVLIEPLSISTLPRHPGEIALILDEYALIISKSIDHYFKQN